MEFKTVTSSSSAQISNVKVSLMMRQVLYALLPGTLTLFWFFGWGVLSNIILAIGFALLAESIMLVLRKRPVTPFLSDYSAVVTAWLLGLALPATSPWWLIAIAIFFAIVIAKQLYGGLGYNPFNPAMIGYAVVLISFPVEMTRWLSPVDMSFLQIGLGDVLSHVFGLANQLADSESWDAMTMATPLDHIKTNLMRDIPISQSVTRNNAATGWFCFFAR